MGQKISNGFVKILIKMNLRELFLKCTLCGAKTKILSPLPPPPRNKIILESWTNLAKLFYRYKFLLQI